MQPFYYWGLEEFGYHASRLVFVKQSHTHCSIHLLERKEERI